MFPGGDDPRAERGEHVHRPNMNVSWNIPETGEKQNKTQCLEQREPGDRSPRGREVGVGRGAVRGF